MTEEINKVRDVETTIYSFRELDIQIPILTRGRHITRGYRKIYVLTRNFVLQGVAIVIPVTCRAVMQRGRELNYSRFQRWPILSAIYYIQSGAFLFF